MATTGNTPPEVSSILGCVDTYLRHKAWKSHGSRQYFKYHPSEWGKAQPLDSVIQTPTGPKKMRDINVGDTICDPHGGTTTVEEILPQGTRPVYEVEFSNSDIVKASDEHLWEVDAPVFAGDAGPKFPELGGSNLKLLTTRQISERIKTPSLSKRFYVRTPEPLSLETNLNLPTDPYAMGFSLGTGLLKTHAKDKFISKEYLYTSAENRLSFLQGLMDAGGGIDEKKRCVEFNTNSPRLADDFEWLVESLGGFVWRSIHEKEHLPPIFHFDISFTKSFKLFRLLPLKHKACSLLPRIHEVRRCISDIRLVGEEEVQCIRVSNEDGLYLTDHCIVTHNCLRKQQYNHYVSLGHIEVEPEEINSTKLRLFDKGHNMHLRWQEQYFADMGVLRGRWKCTNPYCYAFDDEGKLRWDDGIPEDKKQVMLEKKTTRIYGKDDKLGVFKPDSCVCGCSSFSYIETPVQSDELNFAGRADLILDFSNMTYEQFEGVRCSFNLRNLPKEPIVADMKTIGDFPFRKIQREGPHKEYLIQVAIYAHILDLEYGLLIYENKNDSTIDAYRVERNDAVFDTVEWQSKLMQKMADKQALPPPKPVNKDNFECKSCPFKEMCHSSKIWSDPKLDEKREKFYKNLL